MFSNRAVIHRKSMVKILNLETLVIYLWWHDALFSVAYAPLCSCSDEDSNGTKLTSNDIEMLMLVAVLDD